MAIQVSDKELSAILSLNAQQRYDYLIKKIVDSETVWSLVDKEDRWVLIAGTDKREAVPVWPYEVFAQACAQGEWADCRPKAIALGVWKDRWISGMLRDKRMVAAFPIPTSVGALLDPVQMDSDISQELENYE